MSGCSAAGGQPVAGYGPNLAKVLHDVDGDTLFVRLADGRERYVRLIGIDTPEEVKPDYPVECGSRRAAASMRRLVTGHLVRLVPDRTQARVDRYGRLLDYVFVGHVDLDLEQVRLGWAEVYVFHRPFAKLTAFRAAQNEASESSRGVWGRCGGDFHSASRG